MRFWNNLSIQIKAIIAPVLGCIMVLIIGGVYYSTYQNVAEATRQSRDIAVVDETVNKSLLSLGKTNSKVNESVMLEAANANEQRVLEAVNLTKKSIAETNEYFEKIDWNVAGIDSATAKEIKEDLKAYDSGYDSLASVVTADLSMSIMFLNNCNSKFDSINEALGQVSKKLAVMDDGLQDRVKQQMEFALVTVLGCVGASVLLLLLVGGYLGRAIAKPVQAITEVMHALANGDLRIAVPYTSHTDEIGKMANAVMVFKENAEQMEHLKTEQAAMERKAAEQKKQALESLAKGFEDSVGRIVGSVASAATELQANAKNLTTTSDQTNQLSITVATATEEASANVQTVAAAAEELSASIGEISHQADESMQVAVSAVEEVKRTDATVSSLSEAATQIGDVVKLIQSIAEQTNLLALNATIEAARAGEAGKGFAVVASEVKNLAAQTTRATEEISSKIQTVQTVSAEAVDAIRAIGQTIERISEVAGIISSAVQQQNAATREISSNVQKAYTGTTQVSNDIANVTQAATESRQAAGQVLQASSQLSEQSERLDKEIQTFLAGLRQG